MGNLALGKKERARERGSLREGRKRRSWKLKGKENKRDIMKRERR